MKLTEYTQALSLIPDVSRIAITGVAEWGLGVTAHVIAAMQVWVQTLVHICSGVWSNY